MSSKVKAIPSKAKTRPSKVNADLAYWDQHRGKIAAKGGRVSGKKDVYSHGHSIMHDLMGEITYMQMVILNASGQLVEKRLADWFEAHFIGLSWPDPRIWCNHVGAHAGNVRSSVVAGTTAGVLASDSYMYGGSYTSLKGIAFITSALEKYQNGATVEAIVSECRIRNNRPQVMGYVRPVNGVDERIEPIKKVTRDLGFEIGPHLQLALKISDYLELHYNEGINIGGFVYAFSADHNITGDALYRIRASIVASGVTACYVDTADRPPGTFLPLRCSDIAYEGVGKRDVPESPV